MNKTYLIALTATLIAAPAALAHDPAGTPKNYCESRVDFITGEPTEIDNEWNTHDYGPLATGFVIANGEDGNIGGDCNGDTALADYDWHIEWAQGGGWLSVDSGDSLTTGSIFCFGEIGHHPVFGPISVHDVAFSVVQFTVAADTISIIPPTSTDNCGDFQSDVSQLCAGSCTVPFPPGLDGTYQVYVCGSAGHIDNSGVGGGLPDVDCETLFDSVLTPGGCTLTLVTETADNVLDYPGDVVNDGPFAATDELILDQTTDTTEFLGCVL